MSESLWRCEQCGKWSHAARRPKVHQRFIRDDGATEEPAEFISHEPPVYGYDGEDTPGGWWVKCGPFAEYTARPKK